MNIKKNSFFIIFSLNKLKRYEYNLNKNKIQTSKGLSILATCHSLSRISHDSTVFSHVITTIFNCSSGYIFRNKAFSHYSENYRLFTMVRTTRQPSVKFQRCQVCNQLTQPLLDFTRITNFLIYRLKKPSLNMLRQSLTLKQSTS